METIKFALLKEFDMTDERFEELNKGSTNFVKGYWNGELCKSGKELYSYLEHLDNNMDEYLQFGADKAGIKDFNDFCVSLNIDPNQLPHRESNGRYDFYSRDKKLMFTSSSRSTKSGYFHYFGVTGNRENVLRAYELLTTNGFYEDISWGGRDFI